MHRVTSLFLLFSFLGLGSYLQGAPYPEFEAQLLHKDNVESLAVGDVDKDGDLDVVAGEHWCRNPEWKPIKFPKFVPLEKTICRTTGTNSTM